MRNKKDRLIKAKRARQRENVMIAPRFFLFCFVFKCCIFGTNKQDKRAAEWRRGREGGEGSFVGITNKVVGRLQKRIRHIV
jgi:hypothetical protein